MLDARKALPLAAPEDELRKKAEVILVEDDLSFSARYADCCLFPALKSGRSIVLAPCWPQVFQNLKSV
jgi:hypothetical protein